MALECFSWITQLLCYRYDDEVLLSIRRLPDCLIIEILTRLPADCLVRMPKTLVSSRHFSTLHLRRARPLVIMHENILESCNVQKLFVFDESLSKKEEKMFAEVLLKRDLMIFEARKKKPRIRYSCEGVLLFAMECYPPTWILFNPITQEEVLIPHEFDPGTLCAFYYCSLTRQFKLLYLQCEKSQCQYSIYSVRTQTWRRKIRCPTPNLLPGDKPAIVNGAVHLLVTCDLDKPDIPPCAEGIMVLNMDKEELSNMPHPGSCSSCMIHGTMSLLVKDDCLSLCQVFIYENRLDIWILEDYEARLWTKKCKVQLVFNNYYACNAPGVQSYPGLHFYPGLRPYPYSFVVRHLSALIIKPLHFLDGELVFSWSGKGLFMYNMNHNTLRNVEGPRGLLFFTLSTYKKSLLTIA